MIVVNYTGKSLLVQIFSTK